MGVSLESLRFVVLLNSVAEALVVGYVCRVSREGGGAAPLCYLCGR
jgi:hypothetical protein